MDILRTVLLVAVIFSIAVEGIPSPRIIGGTPVDTFRRFSHHVTIHTTTTTDGQTRLCSGSIIGKQWILTSIGCVSGGYQFRLDFNRFLLNQISGFFSVLIDNSTVFHYPTEFDDLALIKIPLRLEYSDSIKAISLYRDDLYSGNQFAVMPGFGNASNQLNYGMFQITPYQFCEDAYGDGFDKYIQLCTRGWNNNKNRPSAGNEGGGLIIGWPRNPQIIGVFSTPVNCEGECPSIYMKVSKYIQWIRSVTGDLVEQKPSTEKPTSTTSAPTTVPSTTSTTSAPTTTSTTSEPTTTSTTSEPTTTSTTSAPTTTSTTSAPTTTSTTSTTTTTTGILN